MQDETKAPDSTLLGGKSWILPSTCLFSFFVSVISHEDSENEMSSDSLGLALHEEDIDEEAYTQGPSMRGRQEEEERKDPPISRLNDALVDAEKEELQSDEQEELPEPYMVPYSIPLATFLLLLLLETNSFNTEDTSILVFLMQRLKNASF